MSIQTVRDETYVRVRSPWASVHVAGPALAVIALVAVLGIIVLGVLLGDLSRQAIGDRAPQPSVGSEQTPRSKAGAWFGGRLDEP
ncbi:MAG: hypothetical protein ACIAS6_01255 [Phycisphaerales bacterium JB060]